MKLNNYKVKIKHLNFEPHSKKSEYSYEDIMYLYYTIQFKSKDCKFTCSSGDVGVKLLEFMQELKLIIQDKYPYAQFDGCRVSILDNSSLLDEATGDSSFKATKIDYEDKTYYSLTFKNPNWQALVLDFLEEDEVKSFISFVENKIEKMLKFQSKVDDIILEVGRDNYEYDLHDIIIEDVANGVDRNEILLHYKRLLQNKSRVDSLVSSFAIEGVKLSSKDIIELYRGYNGELDVEELVEKYRKKVKK